MLAVVSQIVLYLAAAALLGFAVGYFYRRSQGAEAMANLERENQIRIDARDQELHGLRRDFEQRKAAMDTLQAKIDAADVKRLGHEGTIAEREARIRELRGELAASHAGAEKEVEALRGRLKEAQETLKERGRSTADLEAALAKARTGFDAKDKEVAELRARLSESDALQKDLRAQAARLRELERQGTSAKGLAQEISDRDARIQELESRFQAALDGKAAELEKLRRRIRELEGSD